jgi:CPA2 family monovalent cation:H+ antiporter-2
MELPLEHVHPFLRDLAIILTVAAVTTVVSRWLRLPLIVGYLVAGVVVGPATPLRLVTDLPGIRTLSELGIVLLLYSLGLEFSLRRLGRLLPLVGPAAVLEVGLMLGLGYTIGRWIGWTGLQSLFVGAVMAFSSTVMAARTFAETRPPRRVQDLVLGMLIVEDLIAVFLLVFLAAAATGSADSGLAVGPLFKLFGFLALLLGGGMLVLPRALRAVARFEREEMLLVTAVAAAFMLALLAELAGYSVALGAFVGGALARESGLGYRILALIRPVRDMFAAIFFVTVGMLFQPGEAVALWPAVLALTALVILGNVTGITIGGFLTGFGLRTSVQAGMTMANIGEFAFVVAAVGVSTNAAPVVLHTVAVSVSVITLLLNPTLVRLADPVAAAIDRKLPSPLQTFVTLYGSWVELLRRRAARESTWRRVRGALRWMVLDLAVIAGIFVATTTFRDPLVEYLGELGLPPEFALAIVVTGSLALALPFGIGLVTSARRAAVRLAEAAMPREQRGLDRAYFPRLVLIAVLQAGLVLLLGVPFFLLTQSLFTAWPAIIVVGGLLLLLAVSFWRSARNLESHARAGAELIVDVLARQGRDKDERDLEIAQQLLPGLGTIHPFRVDAASPVVGQSLGDLNLRGLTGVTVVGLCRGEDRQVFPAATEVLREGDLLALAGSHDALDAAEALLVGERGKTEAARQKTA